MKWNEFFRNKRLQTMAWVFGCLLIVGISSVQAEQPCTLASLSGSYAFTNQGFITENPNEFFPYASIGRLTFDGAGNYSGIVFYQAPPGPVKGTFKGTYKVKSNCTGSFQNENSKDPAHLVIAHGGDEYYLIGTIKGKVGIGTGKRQ